MQTSPIHIHLFQKFLDITILKMWDSKNTANWIHIENKKDLLNKQVLQMWKLGFLQVSQRSKVVTFAFVLSVNLIFFILIAAKEDVRC